MQKLATRAYEVVVPEPLRFFIQSTVFLGGVGILLFLSLAATYPPLHDTFHDVRHSLAIVPCH